MRRRLAFLLSIALTVGSFACVGAAEDVTTEAAIVDASTSFGEDMDTDVDYSYIEEKIESGELTVDDLIDMDRLEGWATMPDEQYETTTGGGNAKPIVVTDYKEFWFAAIENTPKVIIVAGHIYCPSYQGVEIGSNTTIVGIDSNATIEGGIIAKNADNIIVSNLNIKGGWRGTGPEDAVLVQNCQHVWLDRLNIWDGRDGNMDLVTGVDFITVSWCKFWYTSAEHDHRLSNLVGSGAGDHADTDLGKMSVTYHHCWFADLVNQRMPRFLYGKGHAYNNYYSCTGNSYCIGVGCYASALIEGNYFDHVNKPHYFMYEHAVPAYIVARDNIYDNTRGDKDTGYGGKNGNVEPFDNPPYKYKLDDAHEVPQLVTEGAGPVDILPIPDPLPTFPPKETPTPSAPAYSAGDVDMNGHVTAEDALETLKAVVNLTTLSQQQELLADVNQDQTISAEDALEILEYVVKLIDTLEK